jgi:hypothetical protein
LTARTGRAWPLVGLLLSVLAGCGGGGGGGSQPANEPAISQFTSDRSAYFVGDDAQLTAVFTNGTGRIQPDDIPVQSGQTVTIPSLQLSIRYQLVVSNGTQTVTRDLNLDVSYRERIRTVAMPFARAEHAAVRLSDGRVLIFGGEDNSSAFPDSVWAFDPRTEQFSQIGALATGRVGFVARSLNNGDILVVGGARALNASPAAELIDGTTGAATPIPNAPHHNRSFAAATLLMDGTVLISGGTRSAGADNTLEIYDPVTRSFTLLPATMAIGRYDHTAVRIDQRRVLIYGGFTTDGQPAPPEIYDPVSGTSTLLPAAEPDLRARHTAHTMQDGGVLIIGGENNDGLPTNSVLRFDPSSGVFQSFQSFATPRSSLALGRLVDARILVTGGTTAIGSDGTSATELMSLAGARRDGPAMSQSRFLHTVTTLQNGKLLIVGGLNASRAALASAEIFE